MPSRVLYVLRYYPAASETFVTGEIRALLAEGLDVTVLSMGTRPDSHLATGLPAVEVLDVPRGRALAAVALRHPRADKRSIRLAWAVRQARARGIGRVHAHFAGEAAVLARAIARGLGVPYSVTVHAADLFKPIPGLPDLLRGADPCITVCEHHRQWIRRYGVEATVVRCGIDVDARPQADPSLEPARVVCVARPVQKKGLDRLRRAVPHGRLEIIGAHAPVPPDAITARLAAAQVFALPAQVATDGDRDGVPVAMMEAMAAGLPVVTRPVGGIAELVDDRVGWIADDFEGALHAALSDPAERARRGLAARARIRDRWRVRQSARSLLSAWGRVLP